MSHLWGYTIILVALVSGGCAATPIYLSGENLKLDKRRTQEQVERVLGEPVHLERLAEPTPAGDLPELAWMYESTMSHIEQSRPDPDIMVDLKAWYLHRGALKLPMIEGEALGMAAGLTLGMSELVFIPDAIEAKRHREMGSRLIVFFYSDDDAVVTHRTHYLGEAESMEDARVMAELHLRTQAADSTE
ncbi:MAG: hypothetical protein WD534_02080 [Phycisphaeraceae bacterium]